jgi:hypothetical protein
MKLFNRNHDKITLELTESEIILLNNSLNEILNGVDAIEPIEFRTRLGVTHSEAKNLLSDFRTILKND